MSYNDAIRIRSTDQAPIIAAKFCQHIFDVYAIEVTGGFRHQQSTVDQGPFSIDTFPYNPVEFMKQRARENYGFVPNFLMTIFYSKSEAKWVKHNGEWDIPPLRNVILKGLLGLIKATDYSIVFHLDNPRREVLIRDAGELRLLEDPFWTEERLLLFADISHTFTSQYT